MSELPIIVWDVDDVLNRLMDSWLKSWNQKNDLNVALMNIKDNPPHEILKISKETYFNSLDDFRNSEAGINVEENSIVKNWFENHGSRYNIL